MTHDEIISMEAGEEMDRLVHEKVFGDAEIEICICCYGKHIPHYSAGISEAWTVVEKMPTIPGPVYKEDGWSRFEMFLDKGHVKGDWFVSFSDGAQAAHANGDTAPLAICRCALLAVMEE